MAVDRRDEQRRDPVAGAALIDVGAGLEQRLDRFDVTLPRGQVQRREAAPVADELGVVVLTVDAGESAVPAGAPPRPARRVAAAALAAVPPRSAASRSCSSFAKAARSTSLVVTFASAPCAVSTRIDVGAAERRGEGQRGLALDRFLAR